MEEKCKDCDIKKIIENGLQKIDLHNNDILVFNYEDNLHQGTIEDIADKIASEVGKRFDNVIIITSPPSFDFSSLDETAMGEKGWYRRDPGAKKQD